MERFVVLLSCAVIVGCVQPIRTNSGLYSWVQAGVPAKAEQLGFHFAVKNRNLGALDDLFWTVSNPDSPNYGNYHTLEQLTALVGPEPRVVNNLVRWLNLQGATKVSVTKSRDWVYAEWTVEQATTLFKTDFCWFEAGKHRLVRACDRKFTMPVDIEHVVEYVSGLSNLPKIRTIQVNTNITNTTKPMLGNDPKVLRRLYSIPEGTQANNTGNSQAVTGFLNQWFSKTDLQKFFETYSRDLKGHKCAVHGTDYPLLPGVEANLDVQYVMAIGDGVSTAFWSDDKKNKVNNQEPWASFLAMVANATSIPLLFSASYGDDETSLTKVYMDRVNTELKKIAVRGTSVMAASGDDGSGCASGKFVPNYPATSPYLTAVGGTTGGRHEQAAGLSSGGFSDVYGRDLAPYQKAAVAKYLSGSNLPNKKYWNATGRGFPDVAATAENVPICDHGFCGLPVSGTSCASPTFAGVVGLLNDARLNHKKKPLGFLNPMLYKLAENQADYPFNDITEGAGGTGFGCGRRGWPAAKGWDAVTGLGSPNYSKLVKQVLALP